MTTWKAVRVNGARKEGGGVEDSGEWMAVELGLAGS